jgi:hypothetical protein
MPKGRAGGYNKLERRFVPTDMKCPDPITPGLKNATTIMLIEISSTKPTSLAGFDTGTEFNQPPSLRFV